MPKVRYTANLCNICASCYAQGSPPRLLAAKFLFLLMVKRGEALLHGIAVLVKEPQEVWINPWTSSTTAFLLAQV